MLTIGKRILHLPEMRFVPQRILRATGYGELRMIGYAYIGLRLFNGVFVDRGDQRRVISLRKANTREINRYART